MIELTSKIESLKKIGEGHESEVYDNEDGYVYKVFKHIVDLDKLKQKIEDYNNVPIFENCQIIGFVKRNNNIYYVVKQKKLTIFTKYLWNKIVKAFEESGFTTDTKYEDQTLIHFINGNKELWDIGAKNLGVDDEGNIKLLDAALSK